MLFTDHYFLFSMVTKRHFFLQVHWLLFNVSLKDEGVQFSRSTSLEIQDHGERPSTGPDSSWVGFRLIKKTTNFPGFCTLYLNYQGFHY